MIKALVLDFNGVIEITDVGGQQILNQEIIQIATRAKKRGIKLAILSNYSSELRGTLKEYGIDFLFDAVILSGECDYKKPQKGIFEVLKKSLGVEYNEMLIVDDSEKTFIFQKELGYQYVLYRDSADVFKIQKILNII